MNTRADEPIHTIGQVQVVGVRISFWEMVVLLVKFALAAIPAAIILTVMIAGVAIVLRGVSDYQARPAPSAPQSYSPATTHTEAEIQEAKKAAYSKCLASGSATDLCQKNADSIEVLMRAGSL